MWMNVHTRGPLLNHTSLKEGECWSALPHLNPLLVALLVLRYNFSYKGGSFEVCFRPGGYFYCPKYVPRLVPQTIAQAPNPTLKSKPRLLCGARCLDSRVYACVVRVPRYPGMCTWTKEGEVYTIDWGKLGKCVFPPSIVIRIRSGQVDK